MVWRGILTALLACVPYAGTQAADGYPARPIRLVVPYTPGGNADIQGRFVAQRLTAVLGKQVVVDNRPGASSIIGTGLVTHAPPDGYTMLLVASTHAVNPSLVRKLPYDTLNDLQPISLVGSTPLIFVGTGALPANSVKEVIALARSRPGQLNFGSSGGGSPAHLAGALFNVMSGTKIVHVPYKGMAPATTDLISGQIELGFPSMTSVLPHVRTGKLKAYAITAAARSAIAPELATMSEAGLPGYEASIWNGVLVPSRTPKAIVTRLNEAVVQALRTPEAREHYATMGADVLYGSPAEFDAFIRSEIVKWAKVVRESGIRVELTQ